MNLFLSNVLRSGEFLFLIQLDGMTEDEFLNEYCILPTI